MLEKDALMFNLFSKRKQGKTAESKQVEGLLVMAHLMHQELRVFEHPRDEVVVATAEIVHLLTAGRNSAIEQAVRIAKQQRTAKEEVSQNVADNLLSVLTQGPTWDSKLRERGLSEKEIDDIFKVVHKMLWELSFKYA